MTTGPTHWSESVKRVGQLTQSSQSYGRTDGRTNEEASHPCLKLDVPNAHAKNESEIAVETVKEALTEIIPSGQRQAITRFGEREEIPYARRYAVYRRDEYTCKLCGERRPQPFHLDHVVPWSVGGSDRTDNLRVLCEPCNTDRGNRDDGTDRIRYLPCTYWCTACWAGKADEAVPVTHGDYGCEAPNSCGAMRFAGTSWFESQPRINADDPRLTFAFCAHCGETGYTTVTF